MRSFLKKILQEILRFLAVLTIKKFKPGIVGVTGSVGKTSTKQAIFSVLRLHRRVRVSKISLNNEFGFPLAILGDWKEDDLKLISREPPIGVKNTDKAFFWLKVIFFSVLQLIFYSKKIYPEVLILEYGADRPGDLEYLINIATPHISVITAVGDIPVHVEFFDSPEKLADEKSRLIKSLSSAGVAILNNDDNRVVEMKGKTKGHVITYGFSQTSNVKISDFEHRTENNKPVGVSFRIEHGGSFVSIRWTGVIGRASAYSGAAAVAVGLTFGMSLVKITESLNCFEAPSRRLKITSGIKNIVLIDDSYNASPISMKMALETVRDIKAKRKIGVLGDMLEIGKYTATAHEEIGRLAGKTFDILITVGGRAKLIANSANKAGLAKKNIFSFDSAEEAAVYAKKIVAKNDLVIVKASRGIHLEKIVTVLQSKGT
jgi:UDP-N-acetylmuramoyl-tripeptide--D-alanyl-D-alanine ligase